MSSLAKTNTLATIRSVEIKNIPRLKPAYYIPVNAEPKIPEDHKVTPLSSRQDIPIDKWIMPVQPQGYLSAKQHDIF